MGVRAVRRRDGPRPHRPVDLGPAQPARDSRRYFLNQATSVHDAWIAAHERGAIVRPDERLRDGDTITLGV